ncbi:MAG: hypothetical protein COY39_02285 [Alphaproteobacteria bacterium CG_4_10_14_0_8_um_filter_37_21]|nr:MAG: hypothetical protein COY39_02285 [Alphaproteobacteria bacterium CG_4_10_14_0_8_um_filter_37_21]
MSIISPIDLHISQAIKVRRQFLNLTQKSIAVQLSVSMQQLQKYENGQNKVSASKLIELSKILKFSLATIFSEYETYGANTLQDPSVQPETIKQTNFQKEASRLFSKIQNPKTQQKAINMLTLIALEETN